MAIAAGAGETSTDINPRRWWTLGVLSLGLVIIGVDLTILNVALPTIQRTFTATASALQWMVDSYALIFAGLLLTMGALGYRFGHRLALQVGLIVLPVRASGPYLRKPAII